METKKATKATKRKRLDYLIDYLTELNDTEPEVFDLSNWMASIDPDGNTNKARFEWQQRYENHEPLNCGTTACVAGHLPVAFPDDWKWSLSKPWYMHDPSRHSPTATVTVSSGLCAFFGGTSRDWSNIIYASTYRGSNVQPVKLLRVIRRLEKLLVKLYG